MQEKPFFSWRHAVIKSTLHSTTKHVLLTLACYFNDLGTGAFPSIATLCGDTSLSNRAVITHIQLAITAGWITSFKHGMSGQRWKRNEYQIAWPKGSEVRSPAFLKAVNVVPKGGERSDVKVVNDVHTISSLNSPYKKSRASREALIGDSGIESVSVKPEALARSKKRL